MRSPDLPIYVKQNKTKSQVPDSHSEILITSPQKSSFCISFLRCARKDTTPRSCPVHGQAGGKQKGAAPQRLAEYLLGLRDAKL